MPFEFSKLVRWARQRVANPGVVWRYGFAAAAVLAATGARLAFNPIIGVHAPQVPFALAVTVAALFGGRGPGLAATALSALSVDWFFLEPLHSLAIASREGMWALAVYVVTAALIALLVGSLRESLTARAGAEKALRESEAQFRTLAEVIPQLCGITDPEGNVIWYNRRWYEYTGASFEQTKGWGWLSTLDPEAVPEAEERAHRSVATGEPFEMVFPLRGADGVARPYLTRAMPLRCRDGKVVRWFCSATDISEERKTKEALRKSHNEELARATELQAIMDAMPAAIFIARDPKCLNVVGNRRTYELLGLPPGSNLSNSPPNGERPSTDRIMKEGRKIPAAELLLHTAAATGQTVLDYELEQLLEDGVARRMIGNAVPLLDASGHTQGAVAVLVDVTEFKQAEERLRRVQKLESIGLLAGGVAHDFNNLLASILGNASLATEILPEESLAGDLLKRIIKSGEQAAHLTMQMLAYSGKGQFVIEPVDVSQVVREVTDLVRASVPKKVTFQLDLNPQLPPVNADRSQVHQILMNLVVNAAEAIGDEAGLIVVRTCLQDIDENRIREIQTQDISPGPYVVLEVRDTGCGMDEATRVKIFDPFFTTKFTGRGLGLAAVSGIVRGHKGTIRVLTAPGKGTSFTVFLPALNTATETPDHAGDEPEELRGAGTVLFVDDEDAVRQMAKRGLEHYGFQVLLAADGQEAVEVLRTAANRIDVIVLDLSMSVMSGQETLPELQKVEPGVPVLVSSGYGKDEVLRKFAGSGVAGFIQKPYTVQRIVRRVKAVIDARGRRGSGTRRASP